MKKIANEGRGTVAYISEQDVNILANIYKVVNPIVFRERSIVLNRYDGNGMYRIENAEAISYISELPYIPDMYEIESMTDTELSERLEEATKNQDEMNVILAKLLESKRKINRKDRYTLQAILGVDPVLIEQIVAEAKKGKKSGRKKIRRLDFYLKQQMGHYVTSIQAVEKARRA